jgi:diaminopimelate decarboxylase
MHHLVRPALYQAKHRIFPLLRREGEALKADVVGPVCESSDFLGKDREFVGLREGDWLAIAEAGAYGYSMVSLYNSFPLPRETLF